MTLLYIILGLILLIVIIAKHGDKDTGKHTYRASSSTRKDVIPPGYIFSTDVSNNKLPVSPTPNQVQAIRYMRMLLDIHTPQVPFYLKVSQRKPMTRMGVYYGGKVFKKIIVYDGWRSVSSSEDTAIHELAHHVHVTERKRKGKKERSHGPEFWAIFNELKDIAVKKGYKV